MKPFNKKYGGLPNKLTNAVIKYCSIQIVAKRQISTNNLLSSWN